jgi:hypothetical protein
MELKEEYDINGVIYKREVYEDTDGAILSEYILEDEDKENWTTLLSAITLKKTENVLLLDAVSEFANFATTPEGMPPSLTSFTDEEGNPRIYLLILMIVNEEYGSTEFTYQVWDKSDLDNLVSFSQFSIKMEKDEKISNVLAKYNNNWVSELLQVLRVMIPNGF